MPDSALTTIANTDANKISFDWFRSTFKGDYGVKNSLGRGHAVLRTTEQMDEYLYTYGPMIESQWETVVSHLDDCEPPVMLIDYGCGQGLVGLLINDHSATDLFQSVREIVLIEPSAPSLARAEALYAKIAPHARITTVCKTFGAVVEDDIPEAPPGPVLHLFSNSMDIAGIDAVGLINTALREGRHMILAVSHDRDFNGGTPQIEAVKAAFEDPSIDGITIHHSSIDRFVCRNNSQSEAVVWFCEMDIGGG